MNRLSENSCLKGCMVYLVVLVVIVVGGAFGLGGLSAGLGAGAGGQNSEIVGQAPASNSRVNIQVSPQEQEGEAASPPVPTPVPAPAEAQRQQPAPHPEQEAAPPAQDNTANLEAGTQNRELDISGQATSPFYIVQPGDTLFEVALRFGYSVEALRAANNLGPEDNLIYSGNVLYLPGAEPPTQPESQAPPPPPVEQGEPPLQPAGGGNTTAEEPVPTMPRTGVNATP
jgi:LysM repeat protein